MSNTDFFERAKNAREQRNEQEAAQFRADLNAVNERERKNGEKMQGLFNRLAKNNQEARAAELEQAQEKAAAESRAEVAAEFARRGIRAEKNNDAMQALLNGIKAN